MTLGNWLALFGAMAVLAAVPSVSVLAVATRSVSDGFVHGAAVAMGVVVGDVLFILLALFGLALLAEAMGDLFFLVKYLGGAYLVWLGIALWKRGRSTQARPANGAATLKSSFMTGLLVTLGDQKAVVFYLGFLPAFVELGTLSHPDIGAVLAGAVLAVGGVKLGYAYAADKAGILIGAKLGTTLNGLAACVLVTMGIFILAQAWREG